MLGNVSPGDRRAALKGLGSVGPAAKAALPDVVKALGDREGSVQRAAGEAFSKIYSAAQDGEPSTR